LAVNDYEEGGDLRVIDQPFVKGLFLYLYLSAGSLLFVDDDEALVKKRRMKAA
jgi:hypothetical protein